jgi:hypothetical protein
MGMKKFAILRGENPPFVLHRFSPIEIRYGKLLTNIIVISKKRKLYTKFGERDMSTRLVHMQHTYIYDYMG